MPKSKRKPKKPRTGFFRPEELLPNPDHWQFRQADWGEHRWRITETVKRIRRLRPGFLRPEGLTLAEAEGLLADAERESSARRHSDA